MIVAVTAVRVVHVIADEIVRMVAVRHRLVPAAGPVPVISFVARACVIGRALVGVRVADRDHMLIDVVFVRVMQVTVVEIVDMTLMLDAGVPASRTVNVVVALMDIVGHPFSFASAFDAVRDYVASARPARGGR